MLREALALWRGPALADFLYEPFAQTEIARLEELRTVVVEERIEADLALGRHAELVSELEALVQAQPHRERPRAQLMLALYRSGRQADALAAYRAAREALVDELGIEPGPELKELEAAILRQDDSLLLDARRAAKPGDAVPAARLDPLRRRRRVDGARRAARPGGARVRASAGTSRPSPRRSPATGERSRSTRATPVMAAFGVPVSHEDDALRAARAAFEIQAGVEALNEHLDRDHGIALEIRIGIAAGRGGRDLGRGRATVRRGRPRRHRRAPPARGRAGRDRRRRGRRPPHRPRGAPSSRAGALEIPGRQKPFDVFLLREIAPAAPAFERRLDAKLVGRKRELAAIRKALKRAVDTAPRRSSSSSGPPGIGKSRLAAEVASRAKGVTRLSGRCLSYGDGITYWPLREALEQAPRASERDAVLAALEADTPPPAPEIAWLFRQFCEAAARERPLVLVLDDVHWAEPTFLELVEHVVDRGEGPILVVCVAREELLEERPAFLDGRENAMLVELDALSSERRDALLEGLGGGILESDQRARIVEAAEGNPFFLEQLLAFELEGGLAGARVPGDDPGASRRPPRPARPGRARGARARRGDRQGVLPGRRRGAARPRGCPDRATHVQRSRRRGVSCGRGGRASSASATCSSGGGVPRGPEAPPRRAARAVHRPLRGAARRYRRRRRIRRLPPRAGVPSPDGARRIGPTDCAARRGCRPSAGCSGLRALKRGDMPATVGLLTRAVSLLPAGDAARLELMCELGVARHAMGDHDGASAAFVDAIAGAETDGNRRIELRARIEAAYGRLLAEPEGAARDLLAVAEAAIPTFETFEDDRSLARAWLLIGYVRGGIHGDHAAWEEAEERALGYYRRTEFPPATCMQQIAAAIYWGPTPVPRGIERLATLLEDETLGRFGHATVAPFLGGLYAQAGEFATARALIVEAEHTLNGFGAAATAFTYCGTVRADVELLAGDLHAAEATLREQCDHFERVHDRGALAVRAAKLAEALYRQRRWEESEHWVARLDRARQRRSERAARRRSRRGQAPRCTRGGLRRSRARRGTVPRRRHGRPESDRVHAPRARRGARAADLHGEARRATLEAIDLFERKGNSVAASEAGDLLDLEVPA